MSIRNATVPGRRSRTPDGPAPVQPPTGRRDRRTLVLVASLALVGASIAGFVSVYSTADRKTGAVVLVRSVGQGQPITAADIGEAQIAVSPGVDYIPLDQASVISGKRAVAAMPAGSLLTTADLTGAPAIGAGDAVVGVALKDGAYPASGLSAGDTVLVVQTAAPGASVPAPSGATSGPSVASVATPVAVGPTTGVSGLAAGASTTGDTGVLVPQASVFAVTAPAASSGGGATLLVSLEVPSSDAAQVATASAAGQIGLVLLPGGQGTTAQGSAAGVTP